MPSDPEHLEDQTVPVTTLAALNPNPKGDSLKSGCSTTSLPVAARPVARSGSTSSTASGTKVLPAYHHQQPRRFDHRPQEDVIKNGEPSSVMSTPPVASRRGGAPNVNTPPQQPPPPPPPSVPPPNLYKNLNSPTKQAPCPPSRPPPVAGRKPTGNNQENAFANFHDISDDTVTTAQQDESQVVTYF